MMDALLISFFTYTIPAVFPSYESAREAESRTCVTADVSWIESTTETPAGYAGPYLVRCQWESR